MLLSAYSIGLAIPFLVAAIQISVVTTALRRYGRAMVYIEKAMGVILIAVGILLFMGRFETLAQFGSFFGVYDELALGRNILLILITLALLGLIPAFIASRRGRSFFDWWLFGAGLFPLALPMALMINLKRKKPRRPESASLKPSCFVSASSKYERNLTSCCSNKRLAVDCSRRLVRNWRRGGWTGNNRFWGVIAVAFSFNSNFPSSAASECARAAAQLENLRRSGNLAC